MITCHLFDGPTGPQILDLTRYVRAAPIARGNRGDADLALTLDLPSLGQQLALLERAGLPWVEVHDATGCVWAGRLEDMQAASSGEPQLTAYGPWRALEDARVTALWSDTHTDGWRPIFETEGAGWSPQRYTFDTQAQLFISPNKGDVQGGPVGARNIGALAYRAPDQGARSIATISFDWALTLPSFDWFFQIGWYSAAPNGATWTPISAATVARGGPGTPVASSSHCLAVTGAAVAIEARLAPLFSPGVALAQESGTQFVRLTNVRITTTPLLVNTTITVNAVAGATAFVVASAANIVAGMILFVFNTVVSSYEGERVQVASVVGTTVNLTAPLVANHLVGSSPVVRAQQVLTSDIAADVAATVAALNPGQLDSGTQLIQATAADRLDVLLQDQSPAAVLEALAADEQLSVGVSRERLLWLRPRDQAAWSQSYAVDVSDITLGRTIEELRNQLIGAYSDPDGRPLRTAAATAAQSVARWGLTRQAVLETQTTSATQAATFRDAALADADDPPARAAISFSRLCMPNGASAPLTALMPGDTLTIRNLLISAGGDIDNLTVVRVARVVYDPLAESRAARLTVELENPPHTLEAALAEATRPRGSATPQRTDRDTVYRIIT